MNMSPRWETYDSSEPGGPRRPDLEDDAPRYEPYGAAAPSSPEAVPPRWRRSVAPVAMALVVVVGGAAVVASSYDRPDPAPAPVGAAPAPGPAIDMYSTTGVLELADLLTEATGSDDVLNATIFADWAVVHVPPHGEKAEPWTYIWRDRELQPAGPSATSEPSDEPFDLAALSGDALLRLCGTPEGCTVSVRSPGPQEDDGAWVTVVGGRGIAKVALDGTPVNAR